MDDRVTTFLSSGAAVNGPAAATYRRTYLWPYFVLIATSAVGTTQFKKNKKTKMNENAEEFLKCGSVRRIVEASASFCFFPYFRRFWLLVEFLRG